ncbi:MAG: heme ABC transporter permease [Gammaproteobacteria bacterium]|nr:heme ABC transporter permease [Gammaproteobacteria bacterium]MAY02772.1 heme ABC transporter permease [Gammaproteobacteria bacterium]|tara:strand:+ start:6908 stop:7660 length:753 start_codon:yes stop_codon:yes gene_type:complete
MWKWLYKLGSPKWFYTMTGQYMPWLVGLTVILLGVGLVWGLAFTPPDYQMGENYRIAYIHVPSASIAMGCYYMMACMAAAFLIWRIKMADMVAKACAPVGMTFTAAALFTGSVWGIPTWGTWWIWDARLTSTLIMLFLFIGVMALRSAYDSAQSGAKASAVLTLVGVVNVPIIKYSVEWWNTLHQGASNLSLSNTAANPPEVWVPAFFVGFGLLGFFLIAIILRTRNEILIRERRTDWVSDILGDARGEN